MPSGRLAAAVLALTAACSDSTGPGAPPQIVFTSNRDGAYGIYRMNLDGSGVELLAEGTSSLWSVSPKTGEILYSGGQCDTWIMNRDGSGKRRLANPEADPTKKCSYDARWSPDGSRIAFLSNRGNRSIETTHGLYDVYVMNADGSDQHKVSQAVEGEMLQNVGIVGWTNGRVAFQTNGTRDGVNATRSWTVSPTGSNPQRILPEDIDRSPAPSPDGSRFAFIRMVSTGWQIWIVNADGSGARKLTSFTAGNEYLWLPGAPVGRSPVWSPDGSLIAFRRDGAEPGIYVIRPDGSDARRLTFAESATVVGWSPDGSMLMYNRLDDVFVVNVADLGTRNVSVHPATDAGIQWLP